MSAGMAFSLINAVPNAAACSCIMPESPQQTLQKSAAVFTGRVTGMTGEVDGPLGFGGSSADPVIVSFDVSRAWKGITENRVEIITAQSSASCGYRFEKGKEYLVYAYESEGKLSTGLCSRNALLADAAGDLNALGAGMIFAHEGDGDQPDKHERGYDYATQAGIFIVAALVIGGLAYVLSPRKV